MYYDLCNSSTLTCCYCLLKMVIRFRLNDKADLDKIDISHLGFKSAYRHFLEDITNTGLFREMFSLNYWNLIKIARVIFEKISIVFSEPIRSALIFGDRKFISTRQRPTPNVPCKLSAAKVAQLLSHSLTRVSVPRLLLLVYYIINLN
jgi:hypothetical protein